MLPASLRLLVVSVLLLVIPAGLSAVPYDWAAEIDALTRESFRASMRDTNRLVAEVCATDPRLLFVDVNALLHDAAGDPRPELVIGDQLHLAPAGYVIWKRTLAP